MSRYRKIDVRIWGDERFRSLSPIKPSGQALWLYLLTNKRTCAIPGVIDDTEEGMAAALGWDMKAFREAFREVLSIGLAKRSEKGDLVFIPNAIRYNFPANPNVVLSWETHWDELPECTLKTEIHETLEAELSKKVAKNGSKAFREAFLKACRKPFGNPSGKHCRNGMANQEQEQEQEYINPLVELGSANPTTGSETVSKPKPEKRTEEILAVFDHYRKHHPRAVPKPNSKSKEWRAVRARLDAGYSVRDLTEAIDGMHKTPHNMGSNDKGEKYLGLELCMRDSAHVDRFIENNRNPPQKRFTKWNPPGPGETPKGKTWNHELGRFEDLPYYPILNENWSERKKAGSSSAG